MIDGTCKPGFERVAETFRKNFDQHGEIGASVPKTSVAPLSISGCQA